MWPFNRNTKQAYARLKTEVEEGDSIDLDNLEESKPQSKWRVISVIALCASVVCGTLAIMIYDHFTSFPRPSPSPNSMPNCPLRLEWRTLTPEQQQNYISSVQCLSTHPSALPNHPNSSLHEDFPWIHAHIGYSTHHSAAFLPWHRYFLQIYHHTLTSRCNYTGPLVYWDWTLDWGDLAHSPVFDPNTGFGGDGDPSGPITIGNSGRCVIDGPFAGLQAKFYDVKYRPHCLSRGFRTDDGRLGAMDGSLISPESIEEVLSIETYEDFVASMESRVHDAIPFGISGDFETFTAPYDPLFFLHHVQLDRLWWLWQRRREGRLMEYSGHKAKHSIETAGLGDVLGMGGLAEGVEVREMMDTEGFVGRLCYRY
jgi:tyrosinase